MDEEGSAPDAAEERHQHVLRCDGQEDCDDGRKHSDAARDDAHAQVTCRGLCKVLVERELDGHRFHADFVYSDRPTRAALNLPTTLLEDKRFFDSQSSTTQHISVLSQLAIGMSNAHRYQEQLICTVNLLKDALCTALRVQHSAPII